MTPGTPTATRDHVVFCCNETFAPHCATAIHSLLQWHPERGLAVHVLHANLTPATARKLERVTAMGDCELHLHEVNPRALEHLVLTHDRFTAEVYHRLLIPEVLDVARVLYLDCDTVVLGRLDELFEIDLGDTPVAAVRDAVVRRNAVLGMSPEAPYLNSGVLVMDLERWRSEGLAEQVMDFICSNPDAIRFVDQCGINAVLDGRWMPLDADYNRQVGVLTPRTFGGPCREHPNTRIVHFAGDQKPWLLAERPPWRRAYWRHRNATPFRAMLPDGIRPHSIARLGWRTLVGGVRAVKRWRAG